MARDIYVCRFIGLSSTDRPLPIKRAPAGNALGRNARVILDIIWQPYITRTANKRPLLLLSRDVVLSGSLEMPPKTLLLSLGQSNCFLRNKSVPGRETIKAVLSIRVHRQFHSRCQGLAIIKLNRETYFGRNCLEITHARIANPRETMLTLGIPRPSGKFPVEGLREAARFAKYYMLIK